MKAIVCGLLFSAVAAAARPNPFFVFDNGLGGTNLQTIKAKLDLVKEVGFDGLSWRTDSPERVKEVLEGARQRGLKLFAIYADLQLKDGKVVYDPRLKDIIVLSRGTDTIIWPTMSSTQFKPSDPAGDDIAVADLREFAALCASNKLRVAIYPHVGCWVHRVQDALRVVKKVDRRNVGLTFNLCHALMDGAEDRIPGLLDEVAPYLLVATINGADSHLPKPAWAQLIQPLNKGDYDVSIVLKKLNTLGFKGPIGLQCFSIPGDPKIVLPASIAAWRKLNLPTSVLR
jgi:sugar phosphate isomerase/epimerase